jgi:hypothetical protein
VTAQAAAGNMAATLLTVRRLLEFERAGTGSR